MEPPVGLLKARGDERAMASFGLGECLAGMPIVASPSSASRRWSHIASSTRLVGRPIFGSSQTLTIDGESMASWRELAGDCPVATRPGRPAERACRMRTFFVCFACVVERTEAMWWMRSVGSASSAREPLRGRTGVTSRESRVSGGADGASSGGSAESTAESIARRFERGDDCRSRCSCASACTSFRHRETSSSSWTGQVARRLAKPRKRPV